VHTEDIERVVGAEDLLEAGHAPQAEQAADETDDDRAHQPDVAGRRRDRDEPGDRARRGAEHRRLAFVHRLAERPAEHRGRSRGERVHERERRRAIGLERRTRVEPEPADPQQRGTDHRQRQVVRRHRLAAIADPLADQERADEARDRGVDVHDGAAGEVERAPLPDQARLGVHRVDDVLAGVGVRAHPEPHHVGDRRIAEREPQDHEQQHRREFDALGERADDQAAGDPGESRLERAEHEFGDVDLLAERRRRREDAGRRIEDAVQEEPVEAAEERIALGEREAVAVQRPQHDDQRERHHHLHQHRQHVLAAHQAAVEERESRHRHHDDEQRRDEHPRRVALVEFGRRGGGGCRRGLRFRTGRCCGLGGRGRSRVLRERRSAEAQDREAEGQ